MLKGLLTRMADADALKKIKWTKEYKKEYMKEYNAAYYKRQKAAGLLHVQTADGKKKNQEYSAEWCKRLKEENTEKYGPNPEQIGLSAMEQEQESMKVYFPRASGKYIEGLQLYYSRCGTLAVVLMNDSTDPDIVVCKAEDVDKNSWLWIQWKTGSRALCMKGAPHQMSAANKYVNMLVLCVEIPSPKEDISTGDEQWWLFGSKYIDVPRIRLGRDDGVLSKNERLAYKKGSGVEPLINLLHKMLDDHVAAEAAIGHPLQKTTVRAASFALTGRHYKTERKAIDALIQVGALNGNFRFPDNAHGPYDFWEGSITIQLKAVTQFHGCAIRGEGTKFYLSGDFDNWLIVFLDEPNALLHVWRFTFQEARKRMFCFNCYMNNAELTTLGESKQSLGYPVSMRPGLAIDPHNTAARHTCYRLPPGLTDEWVELLAFKHREKKSRKRRVPTESSE